MKATQPAPAKVQPQASSFQAQRDTQQWPKSNPQASDEHSVVNDEYAATLESWFGIPTAFVLRALKGEPRQRAVALCRLATRHKERNGTLLMLAHKFGTGRARRQPTAGTTQRVPGDLSPEPSVDRSGSGRGYGIPRPGDVALNGPRDFGTNPLPGRPGAS